MASKDLVFRFLGVDAGAGREFDKLGEKSALAHNAIGKLALGAAVAGIGIAAASVKMAASFQTAMEQIHTQAGASQAEVDKMSKSVLALAGPTATAPEELAKGMYHLESTGLRGAKALDALRVAAEGAKIGGADLESVTNALNAVIASGIPGAANLNQAMGALNATVGAGDMRMQDLADAMGTGFLAVVKGFGVTLRDAGAALAVFGDNNIRGAEAASQLRMSVTFLAAGTAKADTVLGKIGLSSAKLREDLASGGLNKALGDLHDHLVAAGDTGSRMGDVLLEAFGHKAGVGLSVLEGQYARFQSKFEEVDAGAKNFASDWKGYNQTFGASWDRAKAASEALLISLGTKLLPVFAQLANFLSQDVVPALAAFGGWVKQNQAWLGPLAVAIGTAVAVGYTLVTVTKAWAAAQVLLNIAMETNPIGLVVVAIAGLAAGLIYAYKHSQTFRDVVQGAMHAVGVAIGFVADHWKAFALGFGVLLGPMGVAVALIVTHFQGFKRVALDVFSGVAGAVKAMWGFIRPILKGWADLWMAVVGVLVHGAAAAFGWVPVLGGKLKAAAKQFDAFRDDVNRALGGIHRNVNVTVTARLQSLLLPGTGKAPSTASLPSTNGSLTDTLYGPLVHKATGGLITGGVPGRDSVPAMLMPGEFVVDAAGKNLHVSGGGGNVTIEQHFHTPTDPVAVGRATDKVLRQFYSATNTAPIGA